MSGGLPGGSFIGGEWLGNKIKSKLPNELDIKNYIDFVKFKFTQNFTLIQTFPPASHYGRLHPSTRTIRHR